MTILSRLFRTRPADVNAVTFWERRRFAKTMAGETAVHQAARLGCIAG